LQEKYGQEMERCYGVGYDWRNTPIDGAAMHAAGGGGKAHEWWDHYYFHSPF
jgi:hypothetical protein